MKTFGFHCIPFCLVMMAVRVQSQLQYNGALVQNHGYVNLTDMADFNRPLSCTTAVSSCCHGSSHGTWVRPDGVNVTTSTVRGVRQVYRTRRIDLYVTRSAMSGIYRCDIQTNDNSEDKEFYYVGIYPAQRGSVTMNTITLTVESANQFTFTCISVGGPVADVYWRYFSRNLGSGGKVLNDSLTARYTLTMTVSQLRTGRYSCSISTDNVHNSNDNYKALDIRGGLNDMTVFQIGLSTIRVTWHANWSNRLTRSYIYYQRLGTSVIASRSINWWANSTDIGGLIGGADYSIYIAHTASNPNTVRAAAKLTTEFITITITSSHPSPTIGDSVTLTCSLTFPTGVTGTLIFKWKRPSGTVEYSSHPNSYGRVSNRLTLSHIAPSDVGKYTCTAFLSGSVSTNTTIPSLQIPRPSVNISRSRPEPLYAGTNFTLTCTVTLGSSIRSLGLSVDISWSGLQTTEYYTTNIMGGSNGRYTRELTISPLATSDSGRYTCRATVSGTNISSSTARISKHISVTDLPSPEVAISGVSSGTAGQSLQLRCTVTVVDHLVVVPSVWWTGGSVGGSSGVTQSNVSGVSTLSFDPLQTSHGNQYTCVTEIHIDAIRLTIRNSSSRDVTVLIPSPVVTVTAEDTQILSDCPLSLFCFISLSPSVDTSTTSQFVWTTPNGHGRVREIDTTSVDMLVIPNTRTGDTGPYSCSVTVFDSSDSPFIHDGRSSFDSVHITVKPNAIISAVYTPVPGEDPEKFELNKFTAGNILMLNCTVRGISGNFTYQWSRVRNLIFEDCCDNATSTLVLPLYSDNAGSYTCIVNESWTSKHFTVSVIGAAIYAASSSPSSVLEVNPLNHNGLILIRDGLRLECISNSSLYRVGTITMPNGSVLLADDITTIGRVPRPGSLYFELSAPITASEQGLYTCTIPDSNKNNIVLNIGVYQIGFRDGPRIKNTSYLYYEVTCGHVICVSTGSPATRVSWMKNGVPLITDGSTYYSLTQIVTDRASSTYYNVLAVNEAVAGIYTCTVSNDLGFESREIPVVNTDCVAGTLDAEVGKRRVTFFWCPFADYECMTHVSVYGLICSPPSVSLHILETHRFTVDGFSPNTNYSCSVVSRDYNFVPAITSFMTTPDYSNFKIPLFFDNHGTDDCDTILIKDKVKIMEKVTDSVVMQVEIFCPECTSENIDNQTLVCKVQFPPSMYYQARLAGTLEKHSADLALLIEKWAIDKHWTLQLGRYVPPTSKSTASTDWTPVGVTGVIVVALVTALAVVVWLIYRHNKMKAKNLGAFARPHPSRDARTGIQTAPNTAYTTVATNKKVNERPLPLLPFENPQKTRGRKNRAKREVPVPLTHSSTGKPPCMQAQSLTPVCLKGPVLK